MRIRIGSGEYLKVATPTSRCRLYTLEPPPPTAVALVSAVYYDNFAEAISVANTREKSTVKLLKDITLNNGVTISSNISIIGNYKITRNCPKEILFKIDSGATLTLDGNVVVDGNNHWTYKKTDGKIDLLTAVEEYSGKVGYPASHFITYEPNAPVASTVMFSVSGNLIVNTATIQNNVGSTVVSLLSGSKMTVNNGALFTHNVCPYTGTVVYMATNSEFVMNGGEMSQNVGASHGTCILMNGGKAIVNDGLIRYNHTTSGQGTFVRLNANSELVMNGGIVYSNVAFPSTDGANRAGAVIDAAKKPCYVTINGGEITNNYGWFTGGINHIGSGLTITNGTLVGNVAWGTQNNMHYNDLGYSKPATITGGIYGTNVIDACVSSEPETVIPDDYEQVILEDNIWQVRKKEI